MSNIDERVVRIKFDNRQFEAGIKQTMDSLARLQKGLDIKNAGKGFEDISSAASKISMYPLSQALDGITAKFSAMRTIAVGALLTIGNQVTSLATRMGQQFTTGPIKQGLQEYETNLNAIQTILSNTRSKGGNLETVNKALAELNAYSDKTIYNFSEMARNIGTFTAAGVALDTSVNAIKGIANLAAVSGSNAEQASSAMYQLSQALATGTVKLMDWNSVVNAGMGGEVFQNSLKETARAHGVAIDAIIKKEGSFRDSLQTGWLSSQILTETLAKFTGDMTADQLKSMGYTQDQIKGILALGKDAQDAATKVKTFTQLMGTLQEAAGSGWSATWQLIFGDFNEARDLFTGVNNVLSGFIGASADARNKIVKDWKDLGGRTALINAIANAFKALMAVLKPIKDAFSKIFPPATGAQLADLSKKIEKFTEKLTISSDTADKIRRIFSGLFAVLDMGKTILQAVGQFIGKLFGQMDAGNTDFLEIAASAGDFLVKLNEILKKSVDVDKFFNDFTKTLRPLTDFFGRLAKSIGDFLKTIEFDGSGFDKLKSDIEPLNAVLLFAKGLFGAVGAAIMKLDEIIFGSGDKISKIGEILQKTFDGIFGGLSLDGTLATIDTGLLAMISVAIKNFLASLEGKNPLDLIENIAEGFNTLTKTLGSLQDTLRATTLLEIAIALAVMAAALYIMAKIDPKRLNGALLGLAALFIQLFAALIVFEKGLGSAGFAKLPMVSASLILLAIGIRILTSAVVILSSVDSKSLGRGLFAIGVLLGELALFTQLASVNAGGIVAGAGLILLATAVRILAGAVLIFAKNSWDDLAKGLVAIGGILAAFAAFSLVTANPVAVMAAGASLIAISIAMLIFGRALSGFAAMKWEDIGKGLYTLGSALTIIGVALAMLPPTTILSAAAIAIVANSLVILAGALKLFSMMNPRDLALGIMAMASSLLVIGMSLILMEAGLPGALALGVAAASILALAPALTMLGQMSIGEIFKALLGLAGAFLVIGLAALVLTPIIPSITALAASILALGAGLALIGLGVFLFATGLTAIAVSGASATVALAVLVSTMMALIPQIVVQLGKALIAFIKLIGDSGYELVSAFGKILKILLDVIVQHTPQLAEATILVISKLLDILQTILPKAIKIGLELIAAFLDGIAQKTPEVVASGLRIISGYLDGIAKGIPKIIDSAFNVVITFIDGLADAIRRDAPRLQKAAENLADAIIDGLVGGLGSGVSNVVEAAQAVASGALDAAKDFLGINSPSKEFEYIGMFANEGMVVGLTKYAGMVKKPAEGIGRTALAALTKSISGIPDILDMSMDTNPVITPVLDMSQVQKEAKQIDTILGTKPLDVSASLGSAKDASAGYSQNKAQADAMASTSSTNVEFNQYNTSPKALSAADIYRQSKNQLSELRGALKT